MIDGAPLEMAIRNAAMGDTVQLDKDVTVDVWNQIWPDGSASGLDGITIDGKGHVLAIKKVESLQNGNYLLFKAPNITVRDIKISQPSNANGFSMVPGSLVNVTVTGGGMAAYLGAGDIIVDGCTFNGQGNALYTEEYTGEAEIRNSEFTGCGCATILTKPGSSFVGNIVQDRVRFHRSREGGHHGVCEVGQGRGSRTNHPYGDVHPDRRR